MKKNDLKNAIDKQMNDASRIFLNEKETSISNDSLEGILKPHLHNRQMIIIDNGEAEEWQKPVICTIHGENAEKIRPVICEAVNNYPKLKEALGDLLTEISPAYNFDFSKSPDAIKKAYHLYNTL